MNTVFVIPAHNERHLLEEVVTQLHAWAVVRFEKGDFAIVISENASTDGTDLIASRLANALEEVIFLGSSMPGKGGAIKWGMRILDADYYVMMDADLSVDLQSVAHMLENASEDTLVIASRRMKDSEVERPLMRKAVTATYAALLNAVLAVGVRDAQCGCKILPARIRNEVLPEVRDDGFFFDTELLARSRKAGFALSEVPVLWEERSADGRGSSVRILRTSLDFIKKLIVLRKEL